MKYIKITKENLSTEHVCCAISNNNDCQVAAKKGWIRDRLDDGLVFLKANARGKCFIEYIPANNAWAPIDADGYLYIDCLWVSGQFKGHGYSNDLLKACIEDGKKGCYKGICALSSKKKLPFLSDGGYLSKKGFTVCDTFEPYFTLMYLPFDNDAAAPRFKQAAKSSAKSLANSAEQDGKFTLYYADQCPYTAKYVPILVDAAKSVGAALEAVHITAKEQAQSAPTPFVSFSLFYNGEFVTHEIQSEQKFLNIVSELTAQKR